MATFVEITRLTGTVQIRVAPRHGTGAMYGTTALITTTLTGAIRKNATADIRGTIAIPVTLSSPGTTSLGRGVVSLEKLKTLGTNYAYSEGRVSLATMQSVGEPGSPPGAYAIGESSLALLSSFGISLGGGVGQSAASLRPLASMGANYAHSAGIVAFEPLTSLGFGEITVPDLIFNKATVRVEHHVTTDTNRITISSTATAKRHLHVTAASTGTITSVGAARALLHLLAASNGIVYSTAYHYGVVSSPGPVAPAASHRFEEGETWLFNALTFAASRVDGYYFDTLARIGSSVYGAGPDGIFEITGQTDDGSNIEASFFTGREDFGVPNVKCIPYGYIAGTSEDKLDVLVVADTGDVHVYETERPLGDTVRSVRFKGGKGLRSHLSQFGIRNRNGGPFEVHHIDLLPDILGRRVKR